MISLMRVAPSIGFAVREPSKSFVHRFGCLRYHATLLRERASPADEAFKNQMAIAGESQFLFPSDRNANGYQTTLKTVWRPTLRRAKVPYFRLYDLRSTYATRLSAGGVADEVVTQMLRQSDARVFKKYSQMKLQMKREALTKLNRQANEVTPVESRDLLALPLCTVAVQ
jgi:hypothetical protein